MKRLIILCLLLIPFVSQGQSYNHVWLLGSYLFQQDPKGRMLIDSAGYSLTTENRKMVFNGTEATISDANGNFLFSSNGIWIANSNNDTVMNGSGLAPSYLTSTWPYGIPLNYGDVLLGYPGDTNKYALFHKSKWGQFSISPTALYLSIIDKQKDSVISKNDTLLADTLSWGVGACKHANGQDWWIFVIKDGNPIAYTYLLTQNGIDTVFTQSMLFTANTYGNVSGIIFSPDGKKMIYSTPINQTPSGTVLLYDFDRCTGLLSNMNSLPLSPNSYLFGLAFSASGKYAYTCSSNYLYQIDTDSLTVDTVATYDGFISPGPICCATTFFGMYLAANGKIYMTSGSSVQHLHEMNFPDSAGIACDVQQHGIDLVDYLQLRAVPNHPNYYLGCDSTLGCPCLNTSVSEIAQHDFHFSISPNPNDGNFKISYLLPQNQSGTFEMFDVNGRKIFSQLLPKWSTMQIIKLPGVAGGIYNCIVSSDNTRAFRKVAVITE